MNGTVAPNSSRALGQDVLAVARTRLRVWLSLVFLVLALPSAALIVYSYKQLKWEALVQYREASTDLAARVDDRLQSFLRLEEARSAADYSFLVVEGEPDKGFVQRSVLSSYPVSEEFPGLIGYFQVNDIGAFSTPLLPADGVEIGAYGLSSADLVGRRELARRIVTVLANNQ